MAKILIVDDDPDVVEATQLFLQKDGHQVSAAFNREDGLKQVKMVNPDLLILDIMMEQPDDGIAMAQELRGAGFKAPIIMMTSISKVTGMGYGKDSDVIPADDFLEKPVQPAVLQEKVKALLKK